MITVKCPRCLGTGNYSYHPNYGTVCFKCNGGKVIEYTEAQYAALQKRANKAAELREIKEEERKAKQATSEYVISTLITRYAGTHEFIKRTRNSPDSYPLQMEAAIACFRIETGHGYRSWIGELAQYL